MKRGSLLLAVVVGPVGFVAGMSLAERPTDGLRFVPAPTPAPVTSATPLPEPTGLATFSTLAAAGDRTPRAPAPVASPGHASPLAPAREAAPLAPPLVDPLSSTLREPSAEQAKRAALFVELAKACDGHGFTQEARRFWRSAAALDPTQLEWLGEFKERDPEGSREVLLATLSQHPQPPQELLLLLADLDPAAAKALTLRALDASSESDLLFLLATLDPQLARERAEFALRADPQDWTALNVLARIDSNAAIPRIEALLQADPLGGDLETLLSAYEELGAPAGALPFLEAALAAAEGDRSEQLYLLELMARADPARSVERWEALGKPVEEEDPYTLRSLVFAYVRAGRTADGLALAGQVMDMEQAMDGYSDFVSELLREEPAAGLGLAFSLLEQDPTQPELRGQIFFALHEGGQADEALRLARSWTETLSDASALRELAGYLAEAEAPRDLQTRAWVRSHELDPRSVEPIRELIELEAFSTALDLAARRLAASPNRTSLHYVVRDAIRSLADSEEPAGVAGWLQRFPGLPMQRDVDYLTGLVESLAAYKAADARAIARQALPLATPDQAAYLRELLEGMG